MNREIVMKEKKEKQAHDIWLRFIKNKTATIGLVVITIIVLVAAFADFIVPYETCIQQNIPERLMPPYPGHIFGTDEFGRDVFARMVHGARRSLALGVGTTVFALTIGCFLGAACGYFGGKFDTIVMRFCDLISGIPSLLFAMAVVAALGANMINLLIAISVSSIPNYTRIIRSVVLGIVNQEYIGAARVCGSGDFSIISRHILPNAIGPIVVQASMSVAKMLLMAAGLSFIGLGVQPPVPEWGIMISGARAYMRNAPYLLIFPGCAIAISALSLNMLGDGLRDALDPRLKR